MIAQLFVGNVSMCNPGEIMRYQSIGLAIQGLNSCQSFRDYRIRGQVNARFDRGRLGLDTRSSHIKELKNIDMPSIQASIEHFGKEHGSEKHSATRWPAPNCSIHGACIAVWPKS